MNRTLTRRPFTTAEYNRMIEARVFSEDDRIELLDGEILEMTPIAPRHAACVNKLNSLLSSQVGKNAIVSVQNPIRLSDYSEPQPDLALLKPRSDFYAQELPGAGDVLVAIEVADTSSDRDRDAKIPAYARALIPEAWFVDLLDERIEIYTQPSSGIYQEIRVILRNQDAASMSVPDVKLKADDILG